MRTTAKPVSVFAFAHASCRISRFRRYRVSEVCHCGDFLLAFASSQNAAATSMWRSRSSDSAVARMRASDGLRDTHHVPGDRDGFRERSTDPIGCPSGKSGPSSDFGFSFVQPLLKKYFCFTESKSVLYSRLSRPTEGRCATSSTRGGMRWTRKVLLTRAFDADGEGVWSWHPDAGVKFAKGNFCGRRWPKSPCTGESAHEAVKTIAWGMPGDSGVT
jgi:hypothetical protein